MPPPSSGCSSACPPTSAPSLDWTPAGGVDDHLHMLPVLVAKRDIDEGEELTLNYHPEWTAETVNGFRTEGQALTECL